MVKSNHDFERDRIATGWHCIPPFTCAGCKREAELPAATRVKTEARHDGGKFRADVAAFDALGHLIGVVEVICSSPPSVEKLASQDLFEFAYYRLLPLPWRNESPAWLCSPDCWSFYTQLAGRETESPWEPRRCDGCSGYFHENSLSWFEFRDWDDDPHYAYCIHCAASHSHGQWRAPGDLAGGDPREWTPDDDADPVILFLAYCDAAFWAMVWSQRVAKLENPDTYTGRGNEAAEEAAARRLLEVVNACDSGEWGKGTDLLSPVGAPGWAAYPGEPQRLLAFRPGNCVGAAEAWRRLATYRLEQLPGELGDIVRRESWGQCSRCNRLIPKTEPQFPVCFTCDTPRREAEAARRTVEREEELARQEAEAARRSAESAARRSAEEAYIMEGLELLNRKLRTNRQIDP